MTQLAKYHDGRTLTRLDDLAQREAVSGNYLVQILNDLRRAGLIESRRGKAGGYLLGRTADQITLRQVVEAVDPELLLCAVTREGDSGAAVRRGWEQISASLRLSLDQITVGSMASDQGDPMFYI
jgi:Rrf2 family transcriptional regulator, cysteine metabolism repressor